MEFLSGNKRIAYPLAEHGTGAFDVSGLLVDASVGCRADAERILLATARSIPPRHVEFVIRAVCPGAVHDAVMLIDAFAAQGPYIGGCAVTPEICALVECDAEALRAFCASGLSVDAGIDFCARCVHGAHRRVESIELVSRACGDDGPVVPTFGDDA